MGRLYEQNGHPQDALRLTRQAIFSAQHNALWLLHWYYQYGRLLQATDQDTGALIAYRQAIDTLRKSNLRQELSETWLALGETSFYQRFAPLYLNAADLYLRQSKTSQDPKLALEKAMKIIEELKRFELQDFYQDPCIDDFNRRTYPVDHLLDKHTAIVYPLLLQDRLELLVIVKPDTQTNILQFTQAIARTEIDDLVFQFRAELQEGFDLDIYSEAYLDTATKLYNALIQPIQSGLHSDIHTLVFVPEGALRQLPLAALYNQSNQRFLIEEYALAITPGRELTLPQKTTLKPGTVKVLAGGTDRTLEVAMAEVTALTELYSGDVTDIEQDNALVKISQRPDVAQTLFFKPHLQTALQQGYTLIHLASHAAFTENPQNSYVETHDGKISFDELERALKSNLYYPRPVELLTLSACETAFGDEQKAPLGLSGITVKVGVRSVLGNLWTSQDYTSEAFMQVFYQQLAQGVSKAQAMQIAQTALLKTDVTLSGHPFNWAPYVLVGNWL